MIVKFLKFLDDIMLNLDKAFFPTKRKKKLKCKNCHCNCHCKEQLHTHWYDKDLCACEGCKH